MKLRPATVDDAAAIAQLHIDSWRVAYATELSQSFLQNQDLPQRIELWQQRLTSSEMQVWLAEAENRLLGFCAHGWSRDDDAVKGTWEIKNLHISPELRGSGIGSRLFDHAMVAAAANHASQLTLWVVESNTPARRFYEKKGMKVDGARQRHVLAANATLSEVRYRCPIKDSLQPPEVL